MRRVPKDIVEVVGMTYWRKLLAHDMATARIKLPAEIARADLLIQQARATGPLPAEQPQHNVLSREMEQMLWQGMPAQQIAADPTDHLMRKSLSCARGSSDAAAR